MQETIILPENIELEYIKKCDLCGDNNLKLWDKSRSNKLSKCKNCGLVFTNPRIANSHFKDKVLYSKAYFLQKSRMTEKLIEARKNSYKLEIEKLEELIQGGKILDVGCGMGIFLDAFNDKWEKHGCDVSSYALEEAKKYGVTVYHGELENLEFKGSDFDVIYFRASLHHSYSPNACLKKAYQLLKPGGVLAICMSNNHSGIAGCLFKARIKSYEQAHNFLFSKKVLKKYLLQNGFKILDYNYPYWNTGYESFSDFLKILPYYLKLLFLRFTFKVNKETNYNFTSPTFYGNYINIYAKKEV